jgi:DNA-binding transcriptional LysR family regulator
MNTKKYLQQLDWSLLASLLAVLDEGSLLAAARRKKMAQPTLGRHIEELESQLGVSLFERTGRALVPTEMAFKLAVHARAMEDASNRLLQEVSNQSTELMGTVRITTSQSVAVYLMPKLMNRMRDLLPEVQIELVSSNQIKNLLRREADIAIRMVRPTQGGLSAKKLCDMPIAAYAHKTYLKKCGTPLKDADLLEHAMIGYDQDSSIIRGFKDGYGIDVTPNTFAFRTDDHIAYFEAVKAGLGIGFIAVYQGEQATGLVRVLPKLKLPSLPVWLATHREIHGNPRIRKVFDFLAQEFAKACSTSAY